MNKLLTIVIPTYNMQDYLHRCLDSLILPNKQMDLLEVLVVNDGSKDNSSAIAHEYEAEYPNAFRVIDKENGNYGSCINRGLKEATGKYIKVLDADDWFDTTEFSHYMEALQGVDVDLVLTKYSVVNANTNQPSIAYNPPLESGSVFAYEKSSFQQVGVYTMHAITYRAELLRSIHYTQTEGISYTDSEWTHIPLYALRTAVYFNYNVYQYLVGREGQTMDPKVMLRTTKHHEIIAQSLIENEEKHPSQGFAHLTIDKQIEYMIVKVYRTRLALQDEESFNHEEMAIFDAYIKEHRPDMYRKMGKLPLKKGMPIPYVLYWRAFGHRFPVDGIRNLYRRIRYGKAED